MPNPDPEHHDLGVKPSAGALRILSVIMPGYQFQSDMRGSERGRAIDAEVKPLLGALENLSNDRAVICIADGDLIDAARAALAAWRGE